MTDDLGPKLPDDVADYVDAEDPGVDRLYRPKTMEEIDWCLQRRAQCQREVEQVDGLVKEAIRRIQKRGEKMRRIAAVGVHYFDFVLLEWLDTHKALVVRGTKKSRDFVYGRLGYRTSPEHLEIEDEKAAQAWADSLPLESALVRTKREPVIRAIQDHFRKTGEVPPGYKVVAEKQTPYISTEDEPDDALAKR